jgi:hypothetical protein
MMMTRYGLAWLNKRARTICTIFSRMQFLVYLILDVFLTESSKNRLRRGIDNDFMPSSKRTFF